MIYGYDWNSQATTYVAQRFNLLVVDLNGSRSDFYIPYAFWMSDLKSKSSSVQIYGYKDLRYMRTNYDYWPEVSVHEDWFVRDSDGNRIMDPDCVFDGCWQRGVETALAFLC